MAGIVYFTRKSRMPVAKSLSWRQWFNQSWYCVPHEEIMYASWEWQRPCEEYLLFVALRSNDTMTKWMSKQKLTAIQEAVEIVKKYEGSMGIEQRV